MAINIANDTQIGKNLTFLLENEAYGIEIKYVRQIIGVQHITPIPNQPPYMKGVINLRGEIIPTMDISMKFGKEAIEFDDRTCIIVLDVNDKTVGVIVERVSEVVIINDENITDSIGFNEDINNMLLRGIGKLGNNVYILLDCNELIK